MFIALGCVVVSAIAVLSFLPRREKYLLHTRGRYHSLAHLIAFGAVGFVAAKTARSLKGRLLLFLGSLVFGVGIELGEHLIFRSALEWKDVLVDAAGVIGGTLVAIVSQSEQGRG